ncbi:MAG: helix-turn-helix domain-containing protein [Thermocrispum sp.]
MTVRGDTGRVEARLAAGRLRCAGCRGVLGGWGHAVERVVRSESGLGWRVRPRRARCRSCLVTHVLLPTRCLLRRGCESALVFAALRLRAAGRKLAAIAASLGVPISTVRDWVARCASRAEALRAGFLRLLPALDPHAPAVEPAGSPLGEVLTAVDAVARAAGVFRRGMRAVSPGELASHLSGGRLLAPGFDPESINTSPL